MMTFATWLVAVPLLLILLFGLLAVGLIIFEVMMFLDIIQNKKLTDTEKLLWAAGIIFFHLFISVIYYFTAYSKRKN